jgi:hypothetical protein
MRTWRLQIGLSMHPILLTTAKTLDTVMRMHTTCCDRPCGGFGFVRTDHGSPKFGHCGHRPDDNSRAPFRSDHSSVPCGARSVKYRSILRRRTRSVGFSSGPPPILEYTANRAGHFCIKQAPVWEPGPFLYRLSFLSEGVAEMHAARSDSANKYLFRD